MAILHWEPTRELSSLQSEMNRVFSTFFDSPSASSPGGGRARRWVPPMDLVEAEDGYVLRADLPGLSESDVAIEVEDNVLTISGARNEEHESDIEGYVRVERAFGMFRRSLTLPQSIDADAVAARFDKGVLEVRVPKPEQRRPRRVVIEVGDQPTDIEGSESASPG